MLGTRGALFESSSVTVLPSPGSANFRTEHVSEPLSRTTIVALAAKIPHQPDYQRLLGEVTPGSNNQVTLVGAFAVLIHAYGIEPAATLSRDRDISDDLSPILGFPRNAADALALPFPLETIGLEIRFKIARKNSLNNERRSDYSSPPLFNAESIKEAIPSIKRNYLVSRTTLIKECVVATGPYLALEFIHTHLSKPGDAQRPEHQATLAIFLHALVLLAYHRDKLELPAYIGGRRKIFLHPMKTQEVHNILQHRDFEHRWKPSLAMFLGNAGYYDWLAEQAAEYCWKGHSSMWEKSLQVSELRNTREDFEGWIRHSIRQILRILSPLIPPSTPLNPPKVQIQRQNPRPPAASSYQTDPLRGPNEPASRLTNPFEPYEHTPSYRRREEPFPPSPAYETESGLDLYHRPSSHHTRHELPSLSEVFQHLPPVVIANSPFAPANRLHQSYPTHPTDSQHLGRLGAPPNSPNAREHHPNAIGFGGPNQAFPDSNRPPTYPPGPSDPNRYLDPSEPEQFDWDRWDRRH
ncbi:hypothetical protein JCM16303_001206 [Sporobolomyces ruberrimus]